MGWTAPTASMCQNAGLSEPATREPPAMSISMIGLDTAKSVFQIHGVNETGKLEIKRKLRRSELSSFFEKQESCTVVMEACGAAHHWARILTGLGHTVKLIAAETAGAEAGSSTERVCLGTDTFRVFSIADSSAVIFER